MDNNFLLNKLGEIMHSVEFIDNYIAEIKNDIYILLGFIKADAEFNTAEGGEHTQLIQENNADDGILVFTDKEISKMPKQFRKLFRTNGVRAHVRIRIRGGSYTYEVRCRTKQHNITASGKTIQEAKDRFIQKLNDDHSNSKPIAPNIPTRFDEFIKYYFETFRKRKVKEATYKNDQSRVNKHLIPYFGHLQIKEIDSRMCQEFFDGFEAKGNGKTAVELFSLLNRTFDMAIRHRLIEHNPLDIVVHSPHESEHGKPLNSEEEKRMLDSVEEPYRTMLAVALYTGIRPNEYETARIVGNIIYAQNSKRHNGKIEEKRIPISPMLRRYLSPGSEIPKLKVHTVRRKFNKVFNGEHILYDLRTTFYTRCRMCGVSDVARDEFMGHSSGKLGNAYTRLPDDYLISEAEKLDY